MVQYHIRQVTNNDLLCQSNNEVCCSYKKYSVCGVAAVLYLFHLLYGERYHQGGEIRIDILQTST